MAPARGEATLFAGGLLASLLAIVAIIGMAARQITRPLATLDATVQEISHGNFAVAPEVISDDELGGLARAIRRMAGHIAQRERQLRGSQQVLEQRVAERTSALRESNVRLTRQIEETRRTEDALRLANEQAQQASRAKSEFLSNMSHELRTPLHGVLGYAQILRRDTATSDSQRESLEAIERCGQHLLTLINDILDLTKIEAGQMQPEIQATDLGQLLEDVHMIVAQRAVAKGLELRLDLAGDLPRGILTDPVKLKQILLNLLGNAVKFTSHGVVTLSAAVSGPGQLGFEVADTGVGIPADKIGAIFDAFHQARQGQAIDGTGLGLAINQRLIGLLGGEALSVESSPGVGSRFRFRIPYQPVPAEDLGQLRDGEAGPAPRRRLAPGQACTLMVVDGLAENRNVVSTLLRYAGCEVEAFAGLADATRRLREKAFDLVLYDVRLLDARVAEAVADLRSNAAFGVPKLAAVSANVFPGADRSARQLGFDAFLAKPFGEEQLLPLIGSLLQVRFETRPADADVPTHAEWPTELARATATRIRQAVDLGDVGSLFQLSEELAANPAAPRADVDNMALMARLFDFDGLRSLSERLQPAN
jgi:signal transduction histidine kinase/CheY-like chemotaxis protein